MTKKVEKKLISSKAGEMEAVGKNDKDSRFIKSPKKKKR